MLEALRLVPAAQIVQVGQRGGATSLFLRGGESNFTKVLIDGIPANDIGGGFDFSQLTLASVERIEVLRQTNSVIYGSDALTGVVNISTRRGTSRVPALDYMIDGGNLGTFNNALSFGGAYKRFDYFSQYSYYTTDNDVPNNGYRNGTYAGRFGVAVGNGTNVYGTVRYLDGRYGSANGFDLYQIADDSVSDTNQTYISLAADSQISPRWQTTVRFGSTNQESLYTNPTPSGIPFDPFGFGANYLGQTVTLEGCRRPNGDRAGHSRLRRHVYPGSFPSRTARQSLFGQATFQGRATWRFRRAAASSTRPATAIPMPTRRTPATTAARSSRDAQRWRTASTSAPVSAWSTTRCSRPPTRHGCRWRRTCVILPTSRWVRRR